LIVVANGCSNLVDHATAQKWVNAIQRQVAIDFAPHWNASDVLHYAGDGLSTKPGPGDRIIRMVRDSTNVGTLGSHWFDSGVPTGECAVQTCIDDGVEPSSCLGHEILEMLADAYATLCFQIGRMMFAAEVCDRVEDTDRSYRIDGVLMENFSLPSAFNGSSGPYDFRKKLDSNIIAPTGYQLQVDIGSGQWTQATGALARRSKRIAGATSRRAARIVRAGTKADKLVLVTA
jgi:hypothetical protein